MNRPTLIREAEDAIEFNCSDMGEFGKYISKHYAQSIARRYIRLAFIKGMEFAQKSPDQVQEMRDMVQTFNADV